MFEFGVVLSSSAIMDSSNEWVGDIGGNGEEAVGEPVADGLGLFEVWKIDYLAFNFFNVFFNSFCDQSDNLYFFFFSSM